MLSLLLIAALNAAASEPINPIAFPNEAALIRYLQDNYFAREYTDRKLKKQEHIDNLEQQLIVAEGNQWDKASSLTALALARQYATAENMNKAAELLERYPQRFSMESATDLFVIEFTKANMDGSAAEVERLLALKGEYWSQLSHYQQATVDLHSGIALVMTDQALRALAPLERAQQVYELVGDQYAVDSVRNILATIHSERGAHQQALTIYDELLQNAVNSGNQLGVGIFQYNIGLTLYSMRSYDKAEAMLVQALRTSQDLNDDVGVAFSQMVLAEVLIQLKRYQQALRYTDLALEFLNPEQMLVPYLSVLATRVEALLALGDTQAAQADLQQLDRMTEVASSSDIELQRMRLQAQLLVAQDNVREGIEQYQRFADAQRQRFLKNQQENGEQRLLELQRRQAERNNARLEQQKQAHQQILIQSKQHQLMLAAVIFLMGFVSFGGVFLWWRERRNGKVLALAAMRDYLTNAPNRRAIMEQLQIAISQANLNGSPLSVALIDLDFFKQVNDLYGHESGDKVLQQFARICELHLRASDSFGRIGGEEWLVIMPNTELAQTEQIFKRLQLPWRRQSLLPDDAQHPLTFSMGAAQLQPNMTLEQLFKAADSALYQAKEQGRDRLMMAAPLARAG